MHIGRLAAVTWITAVSRSKCGEKDRADAVLQTAGHSQHAKAVSRGRLLTRYTAPIARLIDPIVDLTQVSESLAMTVHHMASTVGVTP